VISLFISIDITYYGLRTANKFYIPIRSKRS
jgi:hypothetical protein